MRTIFLSIYLLKTFTLFSQQKNIVIKDSVYVPKSIFAVNFPVYQLNTENISFLRLTDYKFLIADYYQRGIFSSNIHLDLRNFGRYASYEDITDNYNKANLYKFDVSKNTDHFIWTMWDTRLQKQWQNNQQEDKN